MIAFRYIRLVLLVLLVGAASNVRSAAPPKEFYQITVYHFATASQEATLDTYLEKALLPALHRNGSKSVGVFKPIANDTAKDKIIYIIAAFSKREQLKSFPASLQNDKAYQAAGKDYLDAKYDNAPYQRMESIVLEAFRMATVMNLPKLKSPKAEHVYELRSYESPTEKYYISKVKMFNEGGEVALFKRLNFNAVFYADVLVGSRMPNLMYLTCFENMDDRTQHWKDFVDSPEWKKLIAMDEYKNNVNKADIILMKAASYSDY